MYTSEIQYGATELSTTSFLLSSPQSSLFFLNSLQKLAKMHLLHDATCHINYNSGILKLQHYGNNLIWPSHTTTSDLYNLLQPLMYNTVQLTKFTKLITYVYATQTGLNKFTKVIMSWLIIITATHFFLHNTPTHVLACTTQGSC